LDTTSILIPIGKHHYFVELCSKNILDTAGDINIIFLTTKDIPEKLEHALKGKQHLRCPYNFKDYKFTHLHLLDWAFYHGDLPDRLYVQHADVMWVDKGWLTAIQNFENKTACVLPYATSASDFQHIQHKFMFHGKKILRTHDFAAVYNRSNFVENKLTFSAGNVGLDFPISDKLKFEIIRNNFSWIVTNRAVQLGDMFDGSDAIALEIYANCPTQIAEIPMSQKLIHCWDLFAISKDMRREGTTLFIDRPLKRCERALASYSWVSSQLFDPEEVIFPWKHLRAIWPNISEPRFCKILEKYIQKRDINNAFGIKKIVFDDFVYKCPVSLI